MNDLTLALQITLAGMGLVFGAIIVLWGLMWLLTALVRDHESQAGEPETTALPAAPEDGLKARIAALVVALALAEQGTSTAHPLPPPPTAIVSAWQLGMRTRQMYQKGNRYNKEKR